MKTSTRAVAVSLSLRFNGHFPGEPGLAVFTEAKDDGGHHPFLCGHHLSATGRRTKESQIAVQ